MDKKPEIFTAFDLEMAQPSNKIIQIGYCIGNVLTGEILTTDSLMVNPQEQLTPYIITLTGITQEQVDSGTDLETAYKMLAEAHAKYEAHYSPITWGCGDVETLKAQTGRNGSFCFGRRYWDAKTLFQARQLARNEKMQAGLAKALTKMGMQFKGRKHNAESDAINTFLIFRQLLLELKNVHT